MSRFSRRQLFESLSAGALGMLALGKASPAQGQTPAQTHIPAPDLSALARRQDKTRLYYVFSAKPRGLEGWPFHQYDHAARAEYFRKQLLAIGDIDWVGGEIVEQEEDMAKVRDRLGDVDGVVVLAITSPARGLSEVLKFNKPVLLYNDLFRGDCSFLGFQQRAKAQGARIVSLSTADMSVLTRKVQLLRTVGRLRRSKILCFDDTPGSDQTFSRKLADTLGIGLAYMGHKELVDGFNAADQAEAKRIAANWVKSAERVAEPSPAEIVDAAKMYLSIKKLMEQEKANAATVDCLGMVYGKKIPAYPCLAFVQLNNDGYVGACEADLASTLTMLIGGFLADRPGFMSDPVLDTQAGLMYHAHCVAATRMAGFCAPEEPSVIRSHSEDRSGVSLQVKFSPGNRVTAAKYVPFDKMLVSTGEIVGNYDSELACRSKMVTRVEGLRKMLDGYSGGLHRVIFYGDHVEDMEDLGKLLGFETVIETV
jgi:hypothetical protein